MEEAWSPCSNIYAKKDFISRAQKHNITLLGTSLLVGCQRDELISAIASHLKVTAYQLLVRWSLQTGVPAIPQSDGFAHMKENVDVFGFALNDHYMQLISGIG